MVREDSLVAGHAIIVRVTSLLGGGARPHSAWVGVLRMRAVTLVDAGGRDAVRDLPLRAYPDYQEPAGALSASALS
jgi:hypothetical protein